MSTFLGGRPWGARSLALAPCVAGSWVNSLLMTRCQRPVCASQDKILRYLADGLRMLS